jgi:hypothetical protein
VANCAHWADFLAASAEDNASILINGDFLFAFFFLGFEGFGVAKVYAFFAS